MEVFNIDTLHALWWSTKDKEAYQKANLAWDATLCALYPALRPWNRDDESQNDNNHLQTKSRTHIRQSRL